MEKSFEPEKIAMLTGRAIQDDETFKSEGGFEPERDQVYFEMQQGDNTFLLGFKDVLTCLRLMEKMGEVPEIDGKWWGTVSSLYDGGFNMVEYKERKL